MRDESESEVEYDGDRTGVGVEELQFDIRRR